MLDIGAGYGRLAHRMVGAHGERVADYCCVDAVPESTFVSEYYLRHRGVVPPVRVVSLGSVERELEPRSFDLAVNVHSFPEMPYAAIQWWVELLARLEVPALLIVPNEPTELPASSGMERGRALCRYLSGMATSCRSANP